MDKKKLNVHLDSSIIELDLSKRVYNALKRSGIHSVGDLIQGREEETLLLRRNIGEKSILEINAKLNSVEVTTEQLSIPEKKKPKKPVQKKSIFTEEIIQLQKRIINKYIKTSLLHKNSIIFDYSLEYWLSDEIHLDIEKQYKILSAILDSPLNICVEINYLLKNLSLRDILIIIDKYGFKEMTLQKIGEKYDVSRERVRQLIQKSINKIYSQLSIVKRHAKKHLSTTPALLKIQSALNIAEEMGSCLTYDDWLNRINNSGLLGLWKPENKKLKDADIDRIEAFICICRLLNDSKWDPKEFRIPENLIYVLEFINAGFFNIPARVMVLLKSLPKEVKKHVRRHARFTGGINAKWLAQEFNIDLLDMKDLLKFWGYNHLSEDWYMADCGDGYETTRSDVFHNAARKMFLFCGPLPVEEICLGINHAAYRTRYQVPSPDIMKQILNNYSYSSEDNLFYWEDDIDDELTQGEKIIMNCINEIGPIAHHSILAQAFTESELSFASLHKTLSYSPLFKRIDTGLYKLRGVKVSEIDKIKAADQAERYPVNPEIIYDKKGKLIIKATLGVLSPGTGTIMSEHFPNLMGEWKCYINKQLSGTLQATENEFRHLTTQFEELDVRAGDRVKFTFDMWKRSVVLEEEK